MAAPLVGGSVATDRNEISLAKPPTWIRLRPRTLATCVSVELRDSGAIDDLVGRDPTSSGSLAFSSAANARTAHAILGLAMWRPRARHQPTRVGSRTPDGAPHDCLRSTKEGVSGSRFGRGAI